MATDLSSILSGADLGAFQQNVQNSDPYGLIGRSLASWQPDYSHFNAGESLLTSFGKSFASGLLSNYAQNRSADQLNSVVGLLPQLTSDPLSVAVPEDVNSSAFNLLRGTAALNKAALDTQAKTQKQSIISDLLKSIGIEGVKNQTMTPTQAVGLALAGKLPDDSASVDPTKNPTSPIGKAARDLENTTYNRITALPEYKLLADINSNMKSLPALATQNDKASDIALISTIARIRDPNSTVREGEIKVNSDTQSYLDSLYGDWKAVVNGESRIKPSVKLNIIQSVIPKYNELVSSYDAVKNPMLDALETQGGSRKNIPTASFSPFDISPVVGALAKQEAARIKLENPNIQPQDLAAELRSKFGGVK